MKNFILNAENFGSNQDYNRAVLNGYNNGFLKSASLTANGSAFESAINDILPECQHLSVGVHLNITAGKSLTRCPLLTNLDGEFCHSFFKINNLANKQVVRDEIEKEFRAQIEKCKDAVKITHIDSASNIHLIPEIFKIVCKLADEYNIPYIKTIYEEFYIVPKLKYFLNINFICNIFKLIRFNNFAKKNSLTLKHYNIKTNNYYVGLTYYKIFDASALEYGLKNLSDEDNITVETSISPCSYLRNINDYHSKEFKLTQDKILEDSINRMGYDISSHKV